MKSFQQAAHLTVCALLLVAASQVAQSQILDQNAQLEAGASPNPSSAAQNHILKGTYINTVRPLNATQLAAGTTPIDAVTTIMCPGTSGTCTIEFDQNIQLDGTGTDNNQFNLCQLLDGNILAPGCYLMGTILVAAYLCLFFTKHIWGSGWNTYGAIGAGEFLRCWGCFLQHDLPRL